MRPGNSETFKFSSSDPYNTSLNFYWNVDNTFINNSDSSYNFMNNETTAAHKKFVVTGFAYNNVDTASISWDVYDYPLVISSEPITKLKPGGNYNYQVTSFNDYDDSLTYSLDASSPNWLNIDVNSGMITGTAPGSEGDFTVKVSVANKHGQTDEQTYQLNVTNNITLVADKNIPNEFKLYQNYPNPFNPTTTIEYSLSRQSHVNIKIFNSLGQEISELVNSDRSAGIHRVHFDGSRIASGVYFYKMTAGSFVKVRKMMILK